MTAPGCLDPAGCPVPGPSSVDLRRLRLLHLEGGRTLHVAYRRNHWPDLFNATSLGQSRFSPVGSGGRPIPTLCAAASQTVALLETAFHDVYEGSTRLISEPTQVASRGLVTVSVPERLAVVDLTDGGLARVGLHRRQIVATTPQHYACTKMWSAALHERRFGRRWPAGILWASRIAELAAADSILLEDLLPMSSEVCVLFGDRVTTAPSDWQAGDPRYPDLSVGQGRLLAEQIAEQLGAVIVPAA